MIEILKTLSDDEIAAVRQHIAAVHKQYEALLGTLIDEASEEKRQEAERGRGRQ